MQDSSVDSDEEGHSRVDTLNGDRDEFSGLKLKQFDVNKINLDSLIIVIGKRRFGKTTWSQWVLYHMKDYFPRGAYCFTSTKHNYFWQQVSRIDQQNVGFTIYSFLAYTGFESL